MDANENDQNSGVVQDNRHFRENTDGDKWDMEEQCLKYCRSYPGATGCEVIWDQGNRGCFAHTQELSRGSGSDNHFCWVFSKCEEGLFKT